MNETIAIQQAIDRLSGDTAKSCLKLACRQIRLLKEQKESSEQAAAVLIELYEQLLKNSGSEAFWDPNPTCSHVHIVTGESFAGSMKQALKELGWAETHKLITLKDHYAIGPLGGLDSPEGRKARCDWLKHNITEARCDPCESDEDSCSVLQDKRKQIPEKAEVIVWASRSVCEQIGMRHALHGLRDLSNAIRVVDACAICEELYNRPDVSIEYRRSGEIPPSKLREALLRMENSGKLSASDIARLAQEWLAISEQGGVLRIWQNGAVLEVPADYYDAYLLEKLDKLSPPSGDREFIKAARLIGEAVGYCDQDIGDAYFEYRLRELIYAGVLEIQGIPAGMRAYSIRRKRS